MLYIKLHNGQACRVLSHTEYHAKVNAGEIDHSDTAWQSRWDWRDFATVERLAAELTALSEASYWGPNTHRVYLGTDNGPSVSPRYDVVEAPKVGDAVSYAFNGDYHPCGYVVKISKDYRIITTQEEGAAPRKFYRRKLSGAWVERGTWSLVPGHRDERNPSF